MSFILNWFGEYRRLVKEVQAFRHQRDSEADGVLLTVEMVKALDRPVADGSQFCMLLSRSLDQPFYWITYSETFKNWTLEGSGIRATVKTRGEFRLYIRLLNLTHLSI